MSLYIHKCTDIVKLYRHELEEHFTLLELELGVSIESFEVKYNHIAATYHQAVGSWKRHL